MTRKHVRVSRDMVLFTAGLAGIAYETILSEQDRPTLLLLFAAMIGLPAFLNRDEQKAKEQGGSDENKP